MEDLKITTRQRIVPDDVPFKIGTGGDGVLINVSAGLAANTSLADVLIGTPVTPAVAANSVILSNVTASGDILVAARRGANSEAYMWVDSSAGELKLYSPLGELILSPATDVVILNGAGLVIGHTAQVTGGAASEFQVLGTALADGSGLIGMWSADAVGPELGFIKSRHATLGSNTIVNDNDVVARLVGYPADGADFATEAAVFQMEVDDASPAAGDIGMAFVWKQMPGAAGAIAETMRLDAAGTLTLAATTDATSATAAALKTAGGLAVAKKGFFGDRVVVTKRSLVTGGLTGGTSISTAVGGMGPTGEYTDVADDAMVSVFGTGAATPGGGVSLLLLIHAYALASNPANGEEANVALLLIQTGAEANAAKVTSIHSGANIQTVLKNVANSALADVTDGKLGIVIGGGSPNTRFIHVYNRLGGVKQISVATFGGVVIG